MPLIERSTRPDRAKAAIVSAGNIIAEQHDRLVAVSAEDARCWLGPVLTVEEAEHQSRTAMLDVELFECSRSAARRTPAAGAGDGCAD